MSKGGTPKKKAAKALNDALIEKDRSTVKLRDAIVRWLESRSAAPAEMGDDEMHRTIEHLHGLIDAIPPQPADTGFPPHAFFWCGKHWHLCPSAAIAETEIAMADSHPDLKRLVIPIDAAIRIKKERKTAHEKKQADGPVVVKKALLGPDGKPL